MSNSTTALLLPVQVDAIRIDKPTPAVTAIADFSSAPFFNAAKKRIENVETPYISESIFSQPFENDGMLLQPGVHLHWTLPDALCTGRNKSLSIDASEPDFQQDMKRGTESRFLAQAYEQLDLHCERGKVHLRHSPDGNSWRLTNLHGRLLCMFSYEDGRVIIRANEIGFPAVPNRWMVTRRCSSGVTRWIVESDFFVQGEEAETQLPDAVTFPVYDKAGLPDTAPYCRVGKTYLLEDWLNYQASSQPEDYLPKLTAIGHGEASFHSLYTNCHSMFGFHDSEPLGNDSRLSYQVVGWYGEPGKALLGTQDFLQAEYQRLIAELSRQGWTGSLKEQLEELFGWVYRGTANDVTPDALICFGCADPLTFKDMTRGSYSTPRNITIANSGPEAVAHHIARAHLLNSHWKGINRDRTKPGQKDTIKNQITQLEQQLEALQLLPKMAGKAQDLSLKFLEARHDAEFVSSQAGYRWQLAPVNAGDSNSSSALNDPNVRLALADHAELATLLEKLNSTQKLIDRSLHELNSLKRQTYADWYKYMISSYAIPEERALLPDPDDIRTYIENIDQARIKHYDQKIESQQNLRDNIGQKINSILTGLNATLALQNHLKLSVAPTPRYWQPRDPVLAIDGLALIRRNGNDTGIRCYPVQIDLDTGVQGILEALSSSVSEIIDRRENKNRSSEWLFAKRSRNNCFPNYVHLEWEVAYRSLEHERCEKRDGAMMSNNYDGDFVKNSFCTMIDSPHLMPVAMCKEEPPAVSETKSYYTGRSLVSTQGASVLFKNMHQAFLEYLKSKNIEVDDRAEIRHLKVDPSDSGIFVRNYFKNDVKLGQMIAQDEDLSEGRRNYLLSLYQIWSRGSSGLFIQTLGGFHQQLLQQRQSIRLPVDDPQAFGSYGEFSLSAAESIGNENVIAPQPHNVFHPIRAGVLEISRLRLVDSFGLTKELPVDILRDSSESLSALDPMNSRQVLLPPRISQPARLNFRWLAAQEESGKNLVEANEHPDAGPICGWVLANHLDHCLMIYDSKGACVGQIGADGSWSSAPGSRPLAYWNLPNDHLRCLVKGWIMAAQQQEGFIADTISGIVSAQACSDPEYADHHENLALMIGDPIAVVRASVEIELKGLPANNLSWNSFANEVHAMTAGEARQDTAREQDGFEQVQFPVRLGDHRLRNDGMLALFEEVQQGPGSYRYESLARDSFIGTGSYQSQHPDGVPRGRALAIPCAAPPKTFTMLVDPRGSVHASTGILPTKTLFLPTEQYAEALQRIEVSFHSGPFLTRGEGFNLPLPTEPGFDWHYVERDRVQWQDSEPTKVSNPSAVEWTPLTIREGWLVLKKSDSK